MGLSGVQRVAKFVKYLPEFGWDPYVITTGPVAYYAHDPSLLEEVELAGAQIFRTEGKDPNSLLKNKGTVKMPREFLRKVMSKVSNTFFIPDNKKSWANQALELARELVQQHEFDVILVSGPPFSAMIAGATLSTETGIPLVVDYRDLWYGNQFHFYPTPYHAHKHQELEYNVLSQASRITVTNRRMKEKMISTYAHLNFDDVIILPHGFDPDDINRYKHVKPLQQAFTLTYSGIFYDIVTPVYFFKAVQKARQQYAAKYNSAMNIELHFVGLLRDEYVKAAKKLGIADIVVNHGYQNHADAIELCMQSNVLWMMVGNTRNADTISSGKLYEYFGMQKPLLVSVPNGALRKAAEQYGAAWITPPDDVAAIADCIIEMYQAWKQGALPKPDPSIVAQYNRKNIADLMARQLAMATRL